MKIILITLGIIFIGNAINSCGWKEMAKMMQDRDE